MELYSTFDVVKILGINRQTLSDWMARGFICPKIRATGVGTRSKFTEEELILVGIFYYLISKIKRKYAADIIKKIGKLKLKNHDPTYIHIFSKGGEKNHVVKPYYHLNGATGVIKFDPKVETMMFINYSSFRKRVNKNLVRIQ